VHFCIDATRVQAEDRAESEAEELKSTGAIAIPGEGVARVDPRSPVRAGDRASFTLHPERLHFFDPVTQLAIAGA
jgi:hypothetical protein